MDLKEVKNSILKPAFEAVHPSVNNSFVLRSFNESAFSAPYHFHPEYELTLIVKGRGKRFVGNNMSEYYEGDVVLLGANLPHCWKTTGGTKGEINASSIVFHFTEDFLGADFFKKSEMAEIRKLLDNSRYGINFLGNTSVEVQKAIIDLAQTEYPFKRLILFLTILQKLALSKEYILLDESVTEKKTSIVDMERINAVLAYIIENFRSEISLNQAAQIAKMSTTAFCKYFKKITRKTLIETVNDYRINYATLLLIESDRSISSICFDSGFTDLSYFYKTFKSKMGYSPLNYRKRFCENVTE